MEATVIDVVAEKVARTSSPATQDDAKLRMGTLSPTFPPVRAKPANLEDSGQLRMGAMSPSFPLIRTS
jgi:hypothetical protein